MFDFRKYLPIILETTARRERLMSWAVRLVLLGTVTMSGFACARVSTSAKAEAAAPPVIDRVVPTSGTAGPAYPLRVTLEGRHFADSTNTVKFGPVEVRNVLSSDGGTRILVFLPKEVPGTGEVPPAVLQPGVYQITVTTGAGQSNAVSFELKPESGAGP
jgi:hypothetical protein